MINVDRLFASEGVGLHPTFAIAGLAIILLNVVSTNQKAPFSAYVLNRVNNFVFN